MRQNALKSKDSVSDVNQEAHIEVNTGKCGVHLSLITRIQGKIKTRNIQWADCKYGKDQISWKENNNRTGFRREEGRLISSNICYNTVQKMLASCLLSRNAKIITNAIVIPPVTCYGCETCSLALK
jgi:hypothetical protein